MFDLYPTYNPYRALQQTDPFMAGEDVYALQIGLNHVGNFKNPIVTDGFLGPKTSKAIVAVQKKLSINQQQQGIPLTADGVAGQITQRTIALSVAKDLKGFLPQGLPGGQIGHESSFLLGNKSPQRSDGSYDAGVCQRNTNYHSPEDAFDPIDSIKELVKRVQESYTRYLGIENDRRRWELAAGSWNAPAFTNYLAKKAGAITPGPMATPGADALAKIEAYIDSVCAYLVV